MHLEDVVDIHALRRLGLQDDLPSAAEFIEVVDVIAAERGLQSGEDIADADAQGLGALAVDVEPDQRRRGAVGGKDAGQCRVGVRRLHQPARDRGHLVRRRPRIGLQLVFKPGPGAEPDDRRQVERHDNRRRHFGELGAQMIEHAPHAFGRGRALVERGQRDKKCRFVRLGDAVENAVADDRGHRCDTRASPWRCARHRPRPGCAVERGALGQLRLDQQGALILLRQKARRDGAAKPNDQDDGGPDQRQIQQHPWRQPPDNAGIAALHGVDAALHRADDPAGRPTVAQQQSAERRRQGQRVDRRNQHRHRHRDRELLIELADDAGDERDRDEHRQQHQRDCDDRPGDQAHRGFGRVSRRHLRVLGHHVLDRLDDDDRVVDDDPDRQHQRQQRDRVGGKADRQHHRESAD